MDLRERLNAIMKNVKNLQEKGALSPEEITQVDALLKEAELLKKQEQEQAAQMNAQESLQRISAMTEELSSRSSGRVLQSAPGDQTDPANVGQGVPAGVNHSVSSGHEPLVFNRTNQPAHDPNSIHFYEPTPAWTPYTGYHSMSAPSNHVQHYTAQNGWQTGRSRNGNRSYDRGYLSYRNCGLYLKEIQDSCVHKRPSSKLMDTAFGKVGADGGFLVPPSISTTIDNSLRQPESIYGLIDPMPIESNAIKAPYDDNQPWGGGVSAAWTAEGVAAKTSKIAYKNYELSLQKLTAAYEATDEILDDASALGSEIERKVPQAMIHRLNEAIIDGDGVGKPAGILQSDFTITTAKVSNQPAKSVVFRNFTGMWTSVMPERRTNALWLYNAGLEKAILEIKDDEGAFMALSPTRGNQLNAMPYDSIFGVRTMPMMSVMKAPGAKGDLLFADFDYYKAISKGGIESAVSIHVKFLESIQTFRFVMRFNGKVPWTKPIAAQYGDHQRSGFAVLAARA